jgi:hypothetical protein
MFIYYCINVLRQLFDITLLFIFEIINTCIFGQRSQRAIIDLLSPHGFPEVLKVHF